jgi:ABC-type histidine transport system ATPase subunit
MYSKYIKHTQKHIFYMHNNQVHENTKRDETNKTPNTTRKKTFRNAYLASMK